MKNSAYNTKYLPYEVMFGTPQNQFEMFFTSFKYNFKIKN